MTKHDGTQLFDTRPIQAAPRAVSFRVPGKPVGKGRPRAAKRGKHITLYTPEATATYESTVALAASQAMGQAPLIDGPVDVLMRIDLPVPSSWSQRKQRDALAGTIIPNTKPDMDNVIKAVFDAMNGVVWNDDTQVADLRVRRRYSATPGVSVLVMSLEAC
jgi:Holliday junction resolvase RusA-like endonuclease